MFYFKEFSSFPEIILKSLVNLSLNLRSLLNLWKQLLQELVEQNSSARENYSTCLWQISPPRLSDGTIQFSDNRTVAVVALAQRSCLGRVAATCLIIEV